MYNWSQFRVHHNTWRMEINKSIFLYFECDNLSQPLIWLFYFLQSILNFIIVSWRHMASCNLNSNSSGNGFLPESANPIPELISDLVLVNDVFRHRIHQSSNSNYFSCGAFWYFLEISAL